MIRKQTWILLGIFVILAGVAFYLQKNPLKSSSALTPSPVPPVSILKDWKSADITRIDYLDNQGLSVQIEQIAQGSWVLQPEGRPVVLGKIEELRTQILDVRVITTLDPGYDLATVGLSSPSGTITITNAKGDKAAIRIGKITPIATCYYLQINQEQPVVVSNYAIESILDLLKKEQLLDLTPTPEITPSLEVTATQ
ncbi:MAG: DUF4340 domain-containing protein [Anaerolineaceae bacterium]|nr:DUF4340 domain-containing protein [Anaerolineaceae bacterium]